MANLAALLTNQAGSAIGVAEILMPFNIAHLGMNGCVMATFIG
jgi:hypothetical protein